MQHPPLHPLTQLTWVRPLQKRVNTSFMLPPFCMEMTLRWSSSLIHTRKVFLSLCLETAGGGGVH